jgi:asparagine synthetase B (glutamine-hydrolysing)
LNSNLFVCLAGKISATPITNVNRSHARSRGRKLAQQIYAFVVEPLLSEAEYFQQVRDTFEDAVRSRLVSDVPIGAFLSGGIDSAAVVAVMTRLLGHPVSTFAIGFADEPSFNELKYARLVADRFGADHHEFMVNPDAIALLPKLVWHYDQPFADSSATARAATI